MERPRSESGSDASTASEAPAKGTAEAFSKVVDKAPVPAERIFTDAFYALPSPAAPVELTRLDEDAFYLDNVLSAAECAWLVEQTEACGYEFWDRSKDPARDFRSAYTLETLVPDFSALVWQRIEAFVTSQASPVTITEDSDKFEVDIGGDWYPVELNPLLLFGRYLDGGHFSPHTDGTAIRSFNERTLFSGVLYLNEPRWGGQTRLYDEAQRATAFRLVDGKLTGEAEHVLASVDPKPGRFFFFYHTRMHEGVPASDKYFIRTDIFFRRSPLQCTLPEDVEAFDLYQKAQLLAETGDCDGALTHFKRAFKMSPALSKVYGQG